MIYYTNILYELIRLLTRAQKKEIGYKLLENEIRLKGGQTLMRLFFEILAKHEPPNDAAALKRLPQNTRVTNLPLLKKRLIYLILEYLTTTTTQPEVVVRKLMGQVSLLWAMDQVAFIPAICQTAIQIARDNGYNSELAWLLHQLHRAEKSDPEGHTGLRPEPSAVEELLAANQVESDRVEAERLYLAAEGVITTGDLTAAKELIAHPLLARIESIVSFEGRIFAYRALLNGHLAVKDRQGICKVLEKVILLLESKSGKLNPSFQHLIPDYIKAFGIESLHIQNQKGFSWALQKLDSLRKKKGRFQAAYNAAYYILLVAECINDGDFNKTSKIVSKLQSVDNDMLPSVYGYLAVYYYTSQNWENAVENCTKHLISGRFPYTHKMCFWLMKIVSHFESGNWKIIGHVVRDATSALGKKNLGPVEKNLFHILGKVTIKTHPTEIKQQVIEMAPTLIGLLSTPQYKTAESTMHLAKWLKRLGA